MKLLLVFVITAVVTLAADAPSFEAASIRSAAPGSLPVPVESLPEQMRFHGGPGTADPLRIRYTNVTLQDLLARAYGLELLQVSGPGWITGDRYDITATLPAGTDREQLRLMLQGLLSERFKVQMHRESKAVPVYELTVTSGGPKLKSGERRVELSDPDDLKKRADSDARAGLRADLDRIRSGGPSDNFHIANGTMQDLVRRLSSHVDRPIVDRTQIAGNFSLDVSWTPASMSSSGANPDLFAAIEEQLGLKLSARNDVLEKIVVESAERLPEN